MSGDLIELWDWRRRINALYDAVREHDDPAEAHAMWSESRRVLFSTHAQSPIEDAQRAGFLGPHIFPYDPSLRVVVSLERIDETAISMDGGADGPVTLMPFARTVGLAPTLGADLTLFWIATYGGGVFLPFRDMTSGRETFGGGRYLLDTVKGADLGVAADGRTILDFNFSYFPSCAYSSRYVCPLAPAGNRLPVAIRAGERLAPA